MDPLLLKRILEAVLLAAAQPLSLSQLAGLFTEEEAVDNEQVATALAALAEDCAGRGIELKEVASGYRYQIREDVHHWVTRLWTERQTKYSRALLETLALIAYRQPITRAEIEQIRGVAVSSSIIKTLEEREWVRVVGYRDVPGRPALFGTSRNFLDYFNLKSLDELPPLAEIRDLDEYDPQLDLAPVIPPSLELPPEDQEAMAAEAAAEAAAAGGGEAGADAAETDEADADQAAAEASAEPTPAADDGGAAASDQDSDGGTAQRAEDSAETETPAADADLAEDPVDEAAEAASGQAGISDEAVAADDEDPDGSAEVGKPAAAAATLDDAQAADDDEAAASAVAETTEDAEETARFDEAEASAASRESEEPVSDESRSESAGSASDDSTDTTASGSDAAAIESEDSAADTRGTRKPYPAPSAHAPDDAGEDFADAPETADDWSAGRESALDSDDTPDFADSDFSPDDEDVDPPETTTSDDVPEHNA